MHRLYKNLDKSLHGFTIIETMIVLAVASFIILLALVGVSTVQVTRRDNDRIDFARRASNTLTEYIKNNTKFPSCSSMLSKCTRANTNAEAKRVLTLYLPQNFRDPSTGGLYATDSASDCGSGSVCSGSTKFTYENTAVDPAAIPAVGEMFIYSGHWCHTGEYDGTEPSGVVATHPVTHGPDDPNYSHFDRYAILIGTERGKTFCVDNFARSKGYRF